MERAAERFQWEEVGERDARLTIEWPPLSLRRGRPLAVPPIDYASSFAAHGVLHIPLPADNVQPPEINPPHAQTDAEHRVGTAAAAICRHAVQAGRRCAIRVSPGLRGRVSIRRAIVVKPEFGGGGACAGEGPWRSEC